MKRIIKFLFPKTYDAIKQEGFNECWYDHSSCRDIMFDQEEAEDRLAQQELEEMAEWMMQEEEARMMAEIEESARHFEMMQEDDSLFEKQAELKVPEITKPVLNPGDKIHLHSKNGIYTVEKVFASGFTYGTKHKHGTYTDNSNYKCHRGGRWNKKY